MLGNVVGKKVWNRKLIRGYIFSFGVDLINVFF